jgi:DnaK suppressor protein
MKSVEQKLSRTDIQRFQEKLESQRREVQELLHLAEQDQKELDADRPPELGDFCIESATREYLFERASQHRRLLNRIERALQRIHEGSFGECATCGDEIQRKRLMAMPCTECCLHCQDERERRANSSTPAVELRRSQRTA